jgi:hypothetical protein
VTAYSQEFFKELYRIIDASAFHKCRECGIVDGARRETRKGLGKNKAVVRLALVDPREPPRRHGKHGQKEHALCASCAAERKLLWHIRYSRVG